MILYGLFLLIRRAFLRCVHSKNARVREIKRRLAEHNIEATIVRFLLEGNVDFTISCFVAINYAVHNKSAWSHFNSFLSKTLAFLMTIPLLLSPFYLVKQAQVLDRK